MKYFLDTEFLEGPQHQYLFGLKTPIISPNTIDLISIGIVAEDGREYYAISKDFNLKETWNRWQYNEKYVSGKNQQGKVYWLRENVLKPIYYELIGKDIGFQDYDRFFTYKALKNLINKKGKTNKEIAKEIVEFVNNETVATIGKDTVELTKESANNIRRGFLTPEFYAYFADYDWVVFCWLFGKMMDLPKWFPMYCKDLKQMLDEKRFTKTYFNDCQECLDFDENGLIINVDFKKHIRYPKQDSSKSHNAIEDARWNKQLFEFLNSL